MITNLLAAACSYCRSHGRPTPPVEPLWIWPTPDGLQADYRCPAPVCGAEWYATWGVEDLPAASTRPCPGERAA